MILFDLDCGRGHRFEGWFGSSMDYESQRARGLVSCPLCGDGRVDKAVMAPAVRAKSNSGGAARAETERLAALRTAIEAHCDNVGPRFCEEARRRHAAAEAEPRGLVGEATLADAAALLADGIKVAPLPFRLRGRADA